MYDAPQKTDSMTEWCLGLPLVEDKPFGTEEADTLRRESGGWWKRGLLALLAAPTLSALVLILLALHGGRSDVIGTAETVLMVLAVILGVPCALLQARDWLRRGRDLSRDLKAGHIKRFEGLTAEAETGNGIWKRLVKIGALPGEDVTRVSIEVLPASGRIYKTEGHLLQPWMTASRTSVADAPEFASIAAQWLQPVAQTAEGEVLAGRRELSDPEKTEIRRHARLLWLRPLPFALFFSIWFFFPLLVLLFRGKLDTSAEWASILRAGIGTVASDFFLIRGLLLARKLNRDAASGYVGIIRVEPRIQKPTPEGFLLGKPPSSEPRLTTELLFVSQWTWTYGGRPANWRKVAR